MPLIFLPFLIKGAIIATKAIVAQHKVTAVAKGATVLTKTYGAATVATAATTAVMTIGGISWTNDRYNDAKACYRCWERADYQGTITKTASLCSKLINIQSNPRGIIRSLGAILKMNGFDNVKVIQFVKDLCDSLEEIKLEMARKAQ